MNNISIFHQFLVQEEKGIGRPATYAPTILVLTNREYVVKDGKYYSAKGLMLLCILCTMIVFFVAVNGHDSIYEGHPLESYCVHLLIPLLTVFECIAFEDKGVLK